MWLLVLFASSSWFVGLHGCIPTESPDDRPHIPGVFTTTTSLPSATTCADSTCAAVTTTITAPGTTTTSTPTTTSTSTTTTTTTTTTSTTTTTTTTPVCATGWDLFVHPTTMDATCFFISTDRFLWSAARDACVALGAHLAVIHSQEENDFLKDLALRDLSPPPPDYDLYTDSPWIGVSCTIGLLGPMGCGGGTMWTPTNFMNVDGTMVKNEYNCNNRIFSCGLF